MPRGARALPPQPKETSGEVQLADWQTGPGPVVQQAFQGFVSLDCLPAEVPDCQTARLPDDHRSDHPGAFISNQTPSVFPRLANPLLELLGLQITLVSTGTPHLLLCVSVSAIPMTSSGAKKVVRLDEGLKTRLVLSTA